MIKFFSRIRKQLLSKNRFSTYLLYAIGEIALVMVGILLALQVNNWNLSKQKDLEADNYLLRLADDIREDSVYLVNDIEYAHFERDSLDLFFKLMHEDQNTHLDFLRILRLGNWNPTNITLQDNTYREMISSGKFDLVGSEELKMAILDYYKYKESAFGHLSKTIDNGFQVIIEILPDISRFYHYDELKSYDIFTENNWNWINDHSDLRFKKLETSVSHFRFKADLTISYSLELAKRGNNILDLIAEELDK